MALKEGCGRPNLTPLVFGTDGRRHSPPQSFTLTRRLTSGTETDATYQQSVSLTEAFHR